MAHGFSAYWTIFFLLIISPSPSVIAAAGDELRIAGTSVNLREQASAEADVLLHLEPDRSVVEIKREGDWVEIFTNRDDIITGWVHHSLLSPASESDTALTDHTGHYDEFLPAFNDLNHSWQQQNGFPAFTRIQEYTHLRLRLTATPEWLQTDLLQREKMLSLIFGYWSNAVENGSSIDIEVVDQDGGRQMTMFR